MAQETTTVMVAGDSNRNTRVIEEHLSVPERGRGCCAKFFNHFRCWCCREQVLVDLVKRKNISIERRVQRMVKISIDYSKYSNPDSASHARLLGSKEPEAYYKKQFEPHTKLEFYLINDIDFDLTTFGIKRQQAEALCRTVMHLKSMRGNYPSENELDKILDQPLQRTHGNLYHEPKLLQLSLSQQTQVPPVSSVEPRAIE